MAYNLLSYRRIYESDWALSSSETGIVYQSDHRTNNRRRSGRPEDEFELAINTYGWQTLWLNMRVPFEYEPMT